MKSLTVCVVGCGYVGLVTGACLAEIGHRVRCVDSDKTKSPLYWPGRFPFMRRDLTESFTRMLKRNAWPSPIR